MPGSPFLLTESYSAKRVRFGAGASPDGFFSWDLNPNCTSAGGAIASCTFYSSVLSSALAGLATLVFFLGSYLTVFFLSVSLSNLNLGPIIGSPLSDDANESKEGDSGNANKKTSHSFDLVHPRLIEWDPLIGINAR